MSSPKVHSVTVTGLSPTTNEKTLDHFFSFCGKIAGIEHDGTKATVSFVKESAAKTALMLNGGTLDGSTITVTSDEVEAPAAASAKAPVHEPATHEEDVEQEDKPHSAIAAEYLAHGYLLSDAAIQQAIAKDQQYGISSRFLSSFNALAGKAQALAQPHIDRASTKLSEFDEQQGLSLKAKAGATIGSKYYNAALASPLGSKVYAFYTSTQKQVLDVHEEALRIKEAKKASQPSSAPPEPATTTEAGVETPATAPK